MQQKNNDVMDNYAITHNIETRASKMTTKSLKSHVLMETIYKMIPQSADV